MKENPKKETEPNQIEHCVATVQAFVDKLKYTMYDSLSLFRTLEYEPNCQCDHMIRPVTTAASIQENGCLAGWRDHTKKWDLTPSTKRYSSCHVVRDDKLSLLARFLSPNWAQHNFVENAL